MRKALLALGTLAILCACSNSKEKSEIEELKQEIKMLRKDLQESKELETEKQEAKVAAAQEKASIVQEKAPAVQEKTPAVQENLARSFEMEVSGMIGGFYGEMYVNHGIGEVELDGNGKRQLRVRSLSNRRLIIDAYLGGKYIGYYSGTVDEGFWEYKGVFYNTKTGGKVDFELYGHGD